MGADEDEEPTATERPTRPHGEVGDPEGSELLRRWGEIDGPETLHPSHNWSTLIAAAVVVVLVAAVVGVVVLAVPDDRPSTPPEDEATTLSDLGPGAPAPDEPTTDLTEPPAPADGLTVAERGVTVVADRFDASRREATFGAVVVNPNPGWTARGVQIGVELLDEAGNATRRDDAFIEIVLPDQRVAVAGLLFDAPAEPVVDVGLRIDVARWEETGPVAGGFTTADIVTAEADLTGLRTTFDLRSEFPAAVSDVRVTAVYRDDAGAVVAGADTVIGRLEPNVTTPAEIALPTPVPADRVAGTELYVTAGAPD